MDTGDPGIKVTVVSVLLEKLGERSIQPDPFQYWNLKVLLFAFAKMAATRLTALAETQSTLIVAPLVGTTHPWAAVLPSFTRACVEVLVEAVATPPADASATLVPVVVSGSSSNACSSLT